MLDEVVCIIPGGPIMIQSIEVIDTVGKYAGYLRNCSVSITFFDGFETAHENQLGNGVKAAQYQTCAHQNHDDSLRAQRQSASPPAGRLIPYHT